MACCAAVAGATLWAISLTHEAWPTFFLTLLFWLVSGPMVLMGTTITFTHLSEPERQFGGVRLWGTAGWMAMNWAVGAWLCSGWSASNLDDAPRVGALVAFVLLAYTLTLPHTPPRRGAGLRWLAPLK